MDTSYSKMCKDFESFDDDIMRTIFMPIMQWHFQKSAFPEEYTKYIDVRVFHF